jgi:hypothetical protein
MDDTDHTAPLIIPSSEWTEFDFQISYIPLSFVTPDLPALPLLYLPLWMDDTDHIPPLILPSNEQWAERMNTHTHTHTHSLSLSLSLCLALSTLFVFGNPDRGYYDEVIGARKKRDA